MLSVFLLVKRACIYMSLFTAVSKYLEDVGVSDPVAEEVRNYWRWTMP